MARLSGKAKGFTLLEILVAFIVLSVVGSALLQLFHGGLRNIALSSEYSHAALLAKTKMAELDARNVVQPGDSEGRFDDTYHWRLTTEPYIAADGTELPEAEYQAMQMRLSIHWGEGEDERQFAIESLLLTSSDAGDEL